MVPYENERYLLVVGLGLVVTFLTHGKHSEHYQVGTTVSSSERR